MAQVRTTGEVVGNRLAVTAVLIITLIFLAPIYWIASTAFKPRNLATTVPPTVIFQPEISPFVKLFTKRSQLRSPVTPEEYAAAPWWERLVFDGGEKVVRIGEGCSAAIRVPGPFHEQSDRGGDLDCVGSCDGHNHRLRIFALQGGRQG